MGTPIRFTTLDIQRGTARDQLNVLLEVARSDDWFLVFWFDARWEVAARAWADYGRRVFDGVEPNHTPREPIWSRADCLVIDALYKAQHQ